MTSTLVMLFVYFVQLLLLLVIHCPRAKSHYSFEITKPAKHVAFKLLLYFPRF